MSVGAAKDLVNPMQVFLPFQKGSSAGTSMGKHFFVSKDSVKRNKNNLDRFCVRCKVEIEDNSCKNAKLTNKQTRNFCSSRTLKT